MIATDDGQQGNAALRLLARKPTVQVMYELTGGPLRPCELERHLPHAAHSALMRCLAELVFSGAVRRERLVGLPPRAYYSLVDAGRALLAISEASLRWEHNWPPHTPGGVPGSWALRLLADEHAKTILLALGDDSLRPIDLERCLPSWSRSATRHRLGQLLRSGILTRTGSGSKVRYSLSASAHDLRLITALAARWEQQWAGDPGRRLD